MGEGGREERRATKEFHAVEGVEMGGEGQREGGKSEEPPKSFKLLRWVEREGRR